MQILLFLFFQLYSMLIIKFLSFHFYKVSDILSTNKPVECALHNFDPESSQLSMNESDFKSLENHYILIYVDEVCDKK